MNGWRSVFHSRLLTGVLVSFLILSALADLYIKDTNRRLLVQTQHWQQSLINSQHQHLALVLKERELSQPARVIQLASRQLHMTMPVGSNLIYIRQPAVTRLAERDNDHYE